MRSRSPWTPAVRLTPRSHHSSTRGVSARAGRRYEPPSPEALSAARSRVGFDKVALDASALRVRKPAGMQIDLSSMQHGRGADAVSEYLNSLGITSYLVDVGSEIRARGESPEGGAVARGDRAAAGRRGCWGIGERFRARGVAS